MQESGQTSCPFQGTFFFASCSECYQWSQQSEARLARQKETPRSRATAGARRSGGATAGGGGSTVTCVGALAYQRQHQLHRTAPRPHIAHAQAMSPGASMGRSRVTQPLAASRPPGEERGQGNPAQRGKEGVAGVKVVQARNDKAMTGNSFRPSPAAPERLTCCSSDPRTWCVHVAPPAMRVPC